MAREVRPIEWIASSRRDVIEFPRVVRRRIGFALDAVQRGATPDNAKPLHGFGGARVLEIRESFKTDACRAVYSVTFGDVVYVLHCFQKKANRGIATPQDELDVIRQRLKRAAQHHAAHYEEKS